MRLNNVLGKQHLGRMFNFNWFIQGKKKVGRSPAKNILEEKGFVVEDAVQYFSRPHKEKINVTVIGGYERPIPLDENHPSYSSIPCFTYQDDSVLVGGLNQAAVLTNTTVIRDSLPVNLNKIEADESMHNLVKRVIFLSCVYDAEQKKLPKRKNPERPAWVFPRDYGITERRKNTILCKTFANIFADSQSQLSIVEDGKFALPLNAHGKRLLFELSAEVLLSSQTPCPVPDETDEINKPLPNINPLHPTISLNRTNFFKFEDFTSLNPYSKWPHVQTAFLHANSTEIKNLYETEVTSDQLDGRALIKAFTVTAAQARSSPNHITDSGLLKKPLAVQIVQTDGQSFTLGLFVLNTLNVDDPVELKKNVFWLNSPEHLYSECRYIEGRPTLEGYNPALFNKLISFTAI